MKTVTAKQMKDLEETAINELSIPSIILMENAALRAADICLEYLSGFDVPRVLIFAGTGNNGGDGFGIARHLLMRGAHTEIVIAGNPDAIIGDARVNFTIAKNLGITITDMLDDKAFDYISDMMESYDLVVDAMLGTGLCRKLEGVIERAVELINSRAKYVIAIDVPTGINSDTGKVMGAAVKADKTITIGLRKQGLFLYPAVLYTGDIELIDICIPESLTTREGISACIMDDLQAREMLPPRAPRSNKGSFGKIAVLAGSREMPGAAVLTAKAAYRVGAGLVRVCSTEWVTNKIQSISPEVVCKILPDRNGFLCRESFEAVGETISGADVVLIGPGLGGGSDVDEFVREVLCNCESYMVLDADALNSVAKAPEILYSLKQQCVVTPHPGEMSRLTGSEISEILDDPIGTARGFAKKYGVVTVLKDARSIIAAPSGEVYINATGSSALAKAGSGDVLTGIIGGLLSQGLDSFSAAALGCYIHGRAGEIAGSVLSSYSPFASEIADYIPNAIMSILQ